MTHIFENITWYLPLLVGSELGHRYRRLEHPGVPHLPNLQGVGAMQGGRMFLPHHQTNLGRNIGDNRRIQTENPQNGQNGVFPTFSNRAPVCCSTSENSIRYIRYPQVAEVFGFCDVLLHLPSSRSFFKSALCFSKAACAWSRNMVIQTIAGRNK